MLTDELVAEMRDSHKTAARNGWLTGQVAKVIKHYFPVLLDEALKLKSDCECYEAMKLGVGIRIADLEREVGRLTAVIENRDHILELVHAACDGLAVDVRGWMPTALTEGIEAVVPKELVDLRKQVKDLQDELFIEKQMSQRR